MGRHRLGKAGGGAAPQLEDRASAGFLQPLWEVPTDRGLKVTEIGSPTVLETKVQSASLTAVKVYAGLCYLCSPQGS